MERPLINKLSTEIIEQILDFEDVSIKDVINFKKTCKQFDNARMSNKFWQKKFVQRWPRLYEMYQNESFNKQIKNWFDEVKTCSKMKQRVANFVEEMPMTCFVQRFLSPDDYVELTRLWEGKKGSRVPFMMFDELVTMVDNKNVTLKQKYYGTLLLRYLRQHYLMGKWKKLPEDNETCDNIIILVTEWFQPKELLLQPKIKSSLDDFADRVKECFKALHPKHSLFEVPGETLMQWRTKKLKNNQFNAVEGRQIFDFLLHYFKDLNFTCKQLNYSDEATQLFSIPTVLETNRGCYQSLYVIFMSVARRMGIRCDILLADFPINGYEFDMGLPILGWREKYENEGLNNYFVANFVMPNIDMDICYSESSDVLWILAHYMSQEVFTQASRELEAALYDDPDNDDNYSCFLVDQFSFDFDNFKLKFFDTHSETEDPRKYTEKFMNTKSEADLVTRIRDDKVKYTVGSILHHIPSRAFFIITGWELGKSHLWYETLRIDDRGDKIDFVKQDENIILMLNDTESLVSQAMKKEEIGRYFTHFDGICFAPNEKLARIYPDDVQPARYYFKPEILEAENAKLIDEIKKLEDENQYLKNKLQSESAAGDTNE